MSAHAQLMKLIVGYTLTGALVFTVIITCLSLVNWITFADQNQQNKLFVILIVELVVISVGFFGGLLKFDPKSIEKKIVEVEQYELLSSGIDKFVFATEIIDELMSNNWTTKNSIKKTINEYNDSITGLRNTESSNLQLVQLHPDKNKKQIFEKIMVLAKEIDKVLHGLNDEVEKVSVLKTQKKISPTRASDVSDKLKPLLIELKIQVNDFLPF